MNNIPYLSHEKPSFYFNESEVSTAALPLQFIFDYRRGAAAVASKKRKFKKLVNLLKIFILKIATL